MFSDLGPAARELFSRACWFSTARATHSTPTHKCPMPMRRRPYASAAASRSRACSRRSSMPAGAPQYAVAAKLTEMLRACQREVVHIVGRQRTVSSSRYAVLEQLCHARGLKGCTTCSSVKLWKDFVQKVAARPTTLTTPVGCVATIHQFHASKRKASKKPTPLMLQPCMRERQYFQC